MHVFNGPLWIRLVLHEMALHLRGTDLARDHQGSFSKPFSHSYRLVRVEPLEHASKLPLRTVSHVLLQIDPARANQSWIQPARNEKKT